jgi:hypothetical protein
VKTPHVAGYPIMSDPYMFEASIQTPGSNYSTKLPQVSYLSFAPPEVIFIFNNLLGNNNMHQSFGHYLCLLAAIIWKLPE